MAFWFSGVESSLDRRPTSSPIGRRRIQNSPRTNIDNACMILSSTSPRACSTPGPSFRSKGGPVSPHTDSMWRYMSQTKESWNQPHDVSSEVFSREIFSSPNRRRMLNVESYRNPILGVGVGKSNISPVRSRVVGDSDWFVGSQRKHNRTQTPVRTALYPDHRREEKGLLDGFHKIPIEIHHHQSAIEHTSRSHRHYPTEREIHTGVPVKSEYAPYATSMDSEQPMQFSKRMVRSPVSKSSEDVFVRRRVTPVGIKAHECSSNEAFIVAMSAQPNRSLPHNGDAQVKNTIHKVSSDFELRIIKERALRDDRIMDERIIKSQKAFNEEAYRFSTRKTKEHDILIRNKSHTPRVNTFEAPWAINLPSPHIDTVGKTMGNTPWRR